MAPFLTILDFCQLWRAITPQNIRFTKKTGIYVLQFSISFQNIKT